MLTPVAILIVDEMPVHNTGALIKDVSEFVFDDAAIVACLLRRWNMRSGLIGTTLGDDARGRSVARQLKALGVAGKVRLSKKIRTPFEVDVSDRTGARTYFWQREPRVLKTLDTADLSLLRGAHMLYVDWYDGDHILRAMDAAIALNVPVFLNLEHSHHNPDILARYVRRATICQASTDPEQKHSGNALAVARKLLDAGAQTALITLAGKGCWAVNRSDILRVHAPRVQVVDGCGAGATFSSGFIYGTLRGWNLEDVARFATAAASLKVARVGLEIASVAQAKRLAATLKVEHRA
jgi:sugar/nucleoside kinase (ribokinase family)